MIRTAHVRRLPAKSMGERVSAGPRLQVERAESRSPVHHDFSAIPVHAPQVQRWSYGTGTPPHTDYRVVPPEHHKRIDDAMGLLERVSTQPKIHPVCKNYFKSECPGGTDSTFSNEVSNSVVWLDTDNTVWASSMKPHNVGYNAATWRVGRWSLAGEFVHEMMHNCGQDNETSNDAAMKKCGFPDIEDFIHKTK